MTIRIAIVTDIHHGRDGFSKKASQAMDIFQDFAAFANDAKPDIVLDLGDRISDVDAKTDLRLEREVADAFKAVDAPVRHICGNHDVDYLTPEQNAEILGQPMTSEVVDLGAWNLLIWRADARFHKSHGMFALPEQDLLWLAGQIRQASKPTAIFTHVPLIEIDLRNNYWFANNPKSATYPFADRIQAVLEQAHVPLACFSGHVHCNTITRLNGIAYATLQSLSESSTTAPEPAGAWSLLELDDHISLQTFGLDAFQWRMPAAQTARRWVPALPPFPDNPEIKTRTSSAQDP